MIKQELTYWVTLALIPKIYTKRKNEIYALCFTHNPQISIIELFENPTTWDVVGLNDEEKALFREAKLQLANTSFLIEELQAQGYDIFPITHADYPQLLKNNMKYGAPVVVFSKGNKSLLQAPSVAIVGSRKAEAISLTFTENLARKATRESKLIVSGFAKGVDRKALDAALEAGGKSIIILPQGIMTFASGFKQYFQYIVQGKLLVMSTFAPQAPWTVEFAMARNSIIYGMASEIYVAQSDSTGGTWAGATEGIRRGRPIYVRYPEHKEKNANMLLIQKGANAVDIIGTELTLSPNERMTPEQLEHKQLCTTIESILQSIDMISPKELLDRLSLTWKPDKMSRFLDAMPQVEKLKVKNRNFYRLKDKKEADLFGGGLGL